MTLATLYQNAIHYNERETAFIKNYRCVIFSLVFVLNSGDVRQRSFGRTTEDEKGSEGLTKFVTM